MERFNFRSATAVDIPRLISLLNSAYRGDTARKGWTHEADLIEGNNRTDAQELEDKLGRPDAVLLLCEDVSGELQGCVYLEKNHGDLYLGMLSVWPALQGKGIGRLLLQKAEEYAQSSGCTAIVMTVISVRTELLEWYQRNGYAATGEQEPFPNDPRYGKPRQPLYFIWLRKPIS